jgi:hypothetical protein
MYDPQISERIKQRVSESQREYSPREQRAELLLRNQQFLEELYDFEERWHPIHDKDITKELFFDFKATLIDKVRRGKLTERDIGYLYYIFVPKKKLAPSKDRDSWFKTFDKDRADFALKLRALKGKSDKDLSSWFENKLVKKRERNYYPDDYEWIIFCERWRIKFDWDSYSMKTLKDNVFSSPRIISWNWKTDRRVGLLASPSNPIDDLASGILIQIDPWTTKQDIEDLGSEIAKAKKKIFGYAEREARNFGRDLCWHDLHTRDDFGKKSYGEIAQYWKTWGGDKSHGRNMVIRAVNRIQDYIARLTPAF